MLRLLSGVVKTSLAPMYLALACSMLPLPSIWTAFAETPFGGSIFIDPDIILDSDATTFTSSESIGEGVRQVFDRRVNSWININMYLFTVSFTDGPPVEARVNMEFSQQQAADLAVAYAQSIGRIPAALRKDLESITIHDGVNPFGGGNTNLLIHHGQGLIYKNEGILEEVLVHEASHTSLDDDHAAHPDWIAAQESDVNFITTYAANFPTREDVAESFLMYLAADFRPQRLDPNTLEIVRDLIPARLDYFRAQGFDLHPLVPRKSARELVIELNGDASQLLLQWLADDQKGYAIDSSQDLVEWTRETKRLDPEISTGEYPFQFPQQDDAVFYRVRELY